MSNTNHSLSSAESKALTEPLIVPDVSGMSQKEAAHAYLDAGLTPAPWIVKNDTKVFARTGTVAEQVIRATHEDIDTWRRNWRCGLLVSPESDLIAADLDVPPEFRAWIDDEHIAVPDTAWQQTGRPGGLHLLFDAREVAPEDWPRQGNIPGGQVKSNGFIAVEPSIHPNGQPYTWQASEVAPIGSLAPVLATYRAMHRSTGNGSDGGRMMDLEVLRKACIEAGNGDQHDALKAYSLELYLQNVPDETNVWLLGQLPLRSFRSRPYEESDFRELVGKLDRLGLVKDATREEALILARPTVLNSARGAASDRAARKISSRASELLLERQAHREADAREYALAVGSRTITKLDDICGRPKPEWIDDRLTVGLYGLSGPPEAGKSLLARDWTVNIAATGRHALYAMSEGHFDVEDRFNASPLIAETSEHLHFLEMPISLASEEDRNWLVNQFSDGLALVVFDMVYGFGLPDDQGVKDVGPIMDGGKRIAQALECAVLFTGHPGHNGERRFRGSSMWRGGFDGEFHMADGRFTCEKHKYADKKKLHWSYAVEYPSIREINATERRARAVGRNATIAESFRTNPDISQRARASDLYEALGVSEARARALIRDYAAMESDDV